MPLFQDDDGCTLADLELIHFWMGPNVMGLLNGEIPKGSFDWRLFRQVTEQGKEQVQAHKATLEGSSLPPVVIVGTNSNDILQPWQALGLPSIVSVIHKVKKGPKKESEASLRANLETLVDTLFTQPQSIKIVIITSGRHWVDLVRALACRAAKSSIGIPVCRKDGSIADLNTQAIALLADTVSDETVLPIFDRADIIFCPGLFAVCRVVSGSSAAHLKCRYEHLPTDLDPNLMEKSSWSQLVRREDQCFRCESVASIAPVASIPTKAKSGAMEALMDFVTMAKNQTGKRLKVLRSDNDKVFDSHEAFDWKASLGILWERTTPYDFRSNGRVERANRTLRERMTANLVSHSSPYSLWPEAIEYTALTMNIIPVESTGVAPLKAFMDIEPQQVARFLQPFGCLAWVFIPAAKRPGKKGGPRALPAVFIGINLESKGWKFYSPMTSPPTIWGNSARFHANESWSQRAQFDDWEALRGYERPFDIDDIGNLCYNEQQILEEPDDEIYDNYIGDDSDASEIDLELDGDSLMVTTEADDGGCIIHDEWQDFRASALVSSASAASTEPGRPNLTPSVREALAGPQAHNWKELQFLERLVVDVAGQNLKALGHPSGLDNLEIGSIRERDHLL